ncbi:lipopolysaccharide biosynthesis protein [Pseudomonas sp. Marseille-Q1929]|uniref:lipopolysaccharide biosynthesis protein n=1 Tax=Pseudomonas sp. Marseille-Q1929 TaxID=2730402 RepID=UPI001A8ECEF8|nr:lipopolysaccharide biosynthesis protein [Pseudomonas sp. Marseille-Q1929]MBO0494215.1 lipopolysaccharide biosynthesis protein [Pseudomonas sp. Marseille-Q1929]
MKQTSFVAMEHAGSTQQALHAPFTASWLSTQYALDLSDFEACRNTESGAVFIIASGPSAKSFPLEQFAHVPMITMNGAISLFLDTDVKPYFYACTDRSFSEQQPDLFKHAMAISQRVALWEDHARSAHVRPTGRLYPLSKAKRPSWLESVLGKHNALVVNHPLLPSRERPLGFSKDMSEGFFDARTVAYLAIQLAFHVGFTQVFLVGVDLDERSGRFYENAASTHSPCGLDQHYFTRILPSFELMSDKVIGDDFRVYNLSDISRIPDSVVPHATLADVEEMLA